MKVRVLKAKASRPSPGPEFWVRVSWTTMEGEPPVEVVHYQALDDMTSAQFTLLAANVGKDLEVDFTGAVVSVVEVSV